jgi:hypothetical protein
MPQFELGPRCSPDSTANATNFRHAVFAKEPALCHEIGSLIVIRVNALRADRAPNFVTAYLLCAKQAAQKGLLRPARFRKPPHRCQNGGMTTGGPNIGA